MSRRPYYLAFIALASLALLTTGVAYIDLGFLNVPIALTIAAIKALIVALWFMHLRRGEMLVRVIAISGLIWLVILLMTLGDYLTRGWLGMPGRS